MIHTKNFYLKIFAQKKKILPNKMKNKKTKIKKQKFQKGKGKGKENKKILFSKLLT